MPIARQRVAKHIPAEANERNSMTSIARQRSGEHAFATIEEAVFSMDPPRYYIVVQKSVTEREREWGESSAVKEDGFG
jgi:hypothetical protein